MAAMPAARICAGVSKSGSPTDRLMTSLPSRRSCAARAVMARVGEGFTRWTRRETAIFMDRYSTEFHCMNDGRFELAAQYEPAGDQPEAIARLVEGIESGLAAQTLLGVTGSGKTFTIANVIQKIQRPTLVIAHNKTLAAQLYGEFREFFPHNAVEYFVSYYD